MSLAEIVFQETLYNCAHKIKVFKIVIQQINAYNGYYISVIKIVATWKRQAFKKIKNLNNMQVFKFLLFTNNDLSLFFFSNENIL